MREATIKSMLIKHLAIYGGLEARKSNLLIHGIRIIRVRTFFKSKPRIHPNITAKGLLQVVARNNPP